MKEIKETVEEAKDIIVKLRAEAIDHTDDWNKYPHKRSLKDINTRINKLWDDLKELETNYNKLLADQKPDNLPADWGTQLADKKQLEIKLNAAQTDLSSEQQARQQAENKVRQAEQFGLTDWDNLTNQTGGETLADLLGQTEREAFSLKKLKDTLNNSFPNLIDNENEVNEEVQKGIVEDLIKLKEIQKQVDEESRIVEKLSALISRIESETTPQKPGRVEIRVLVEETKESLGKIVDELQKEVDSRNLSEEYQNQQIQLPKK